MTLPDGQYGVICYYFDSTKLREAEEALRVANKRLTLAQEASDAGVWEWDIATGQLAWSSELFRLFGLDPVGGTASFEVWRRVMHPEDRVSAEARTEEAVRNRMPLSNEYRVVLPTGEVRWINALGNTQYGASGEALRMSGICLDITARKQAESCIAGSKRQPGEKGAGADT